MFVKCPRCHSLVAFDAATGAAPEYCPYCDGPIAADSTLSQDDLPQDDASPATIEELASDDSDAFDAAAPDDISEVELEQVSAEADDIAAPATIVPEPVAATTAESPAPTVGTPGKPDEPAKENETAAAPASPAPSAAAKPRKRNAPSFAKRPVYAPNRPTPRWFWAIAGGLALLAGLQILFADRAQLAQDARWRPLIASVCGALHCTIPPWREPAAFTMLGRDVRQHPYMPGALRVDATFRNNARWPQPWPELVLTLSDINGRALGMRTFSPREYLDKKVTQKEIASGQTAAIRMEVMEPGAGVVSFSFDFR